MLIILVYAKCTLFWTEKQGQVIKGHEMEFQACCWRSAGACKLADKSEVYTGVNLDTVKLKEIWCIEK